MSRSNSTNRAARNVVVVEALENRQFLAADLSVAITSTTLADSLVIGGKNKPATVALAITNAGDAIDKKTTKGNFTVSVGLDDGLGNVTPLGTASVKAATLAKPAGAKAKVKAPIPSTLAEGTYTLVATVDGGTVVPEENTANNSAAGKAVDVSVANSDLTVTATTTLSGTVAAGAKGTVSLAVTNVGNVAAKATGTVTVLSIVDGEKTVLTTVENVKVNVKPGATVNLKPIAVAAAGVAGQSVEAVIGAVLVSTAPGDTVGNNEAIAGTITVAPAPAGALDVIGLGSTLTFKTTQSQGIGGTGFETGNWSDAETGKSGTYYITTGLASDGTCSFTLANGTPLAGLKFAFNSGKTKLGNQTLTFGVDPSAAIGNVQVAGQTVYFAK